MNRLVEGFPAMFYAAATNDAEDFRTWVKYGGDVGVIHKASGVPLLAFTILQSETLQTGPTLTVATLLSHEASYNVIPAAFYTPYWRDLPDPSSDNDILTDLTDEHGDWCRES